MYNNGLLSRKEMIELTNTAINYKIILWQLLCPITFAVGEIIPNAQVENQRTR